MMNHKKGEKIEEGEDGTYIEDGDSLNPMIVSYNEGGHNCTFVSVLTIIDWVKKNRPDLLVDPPGA